MLPQADVRCGKAVKIGALAIKATGHVSTGKTQHAVCSADAVGNAIMVECFRAEIDVERLGCGHISAAQYVIAAALAALCRWQGHEIIGRGVSLYFGGACFEQWVTLHFLGNKRLDFH